MDTLFLILTGTSAPNSFETENGGLQVPSISRSKDQVIEILGIITELLPPLPKSKSVIAAMVDVVRSRFNSRRCFLDN